MSDLKQLAAIAALNKMFTDGWLSISTVDRVGKMLGVDPKRAADSYNILHAVHCVHFAQMPVDLRDAIPQLILDCLDVAPTFQFKAPTTISQFVERVPEKQRSSVARLLGIGGK